MALTKVSTDGVKDDAITKTKIPANQIEASELADNAVDTNAIADQAVALSKLPHGTSSNNGKFLRANNGADPTFETVSTDLVADTTPQLGGDLASNSHDIVSADNDQIKLGASNDFTMFHDNSGHTFLQDQGNGALRIRSDNEVAIQKWDGTTNENMAKFVPDGAVELYHDNGIRLTTTSTGINVTQLGSSFSNFHHGGGASGVRIAGPAAASSANLVFANNFDNSVSDEWAISLDGATDDLVFKSEGAGGTDRIRFLDNGGICFGSDTAAANALDDYEEGNWTPTGSGFTVSSVVSARYTKVGRLVTINAYVNAATGNGTAAVVITNLPFSQYGNSNYHYGNGRIGSAGGNTNSQNNITFQIQQNSNSAKIYVNDGGINEQMISGQHIIFSATYEAA